MSDLPITQELLPSRFSKKTLTAMISMITLGAVNVILFKMQTTTFKLPTDSFQIQVFIVFAGQYINILIFYLKLKFKRKKLITHFKNHQRKALFQGKLGKFSRLRILIASLLNFGAVFLQLRALTFLPPLLFQMFLGFGAVFTPFISRVFLKKTIYFHTGIGILISALGFAFMFLTSFFFTVEGMGFNGDFVYAFVILFFSLLFSSGQGVYEEWLSDRITISSSRFVGLEGIFGLILLTFCSLGFHFYSLFSGMKTFDIGVDIMIVYRNHTLLVTSLFLMASSTMYELSSITLTSKISTTFRMMNDILKVILIWIAQIFFFDMEIPNLDLSKYLLFTAARLFCYFLLVIGNVLINEIFEISCCGLNRHFGRYTNTRLHSSSKSLIEEYSIIKF